MLSIIKTVLRLRGDSFSALLILVSLTFLAGHADGNGIPEAENAKAAQGDLKTIIEKVEKRYKSLQNFQADFVQLARILSYPEDQRSEGRVYLKRDRMMRWDYSLPSKDQYFIQGDRVLFYSPDVKQARRINIKGGNGLRSPLVFFEGLKAAEADYQLSINSDPIFDRSTRYVLQLTPKNREQAKLLKILLFVDKSDYQVNRIDQYDLYGNVTELYFKNVQVNKDLPASLFTFTPPPGVEVIEQP